MPKRIPTADKPAFIVRFRLRVRRASGRYGWSNIDTPCDSAEQAIALVQNVNGGRAMALRGARYIALRMPAK